LALPKALRPDPDYRRDLVFASIRFGEYIRPAPECKNPSQSEGFRDPDWTDFKPVMGRFPAFVNFKLGFVTFQFAVTPSPLQEESAFL